jgi:DNA-binding CsgD family transcriptional regulator
LTPSERRVALLAAEGHTTRQIAAELFVTPKTVEFHLSHVYRKLGVPSTRADLASVLHRDPATTTGSSGGEVVIRPGISRS